MAHLSTQQSQVIFEKNRSVGVCEWDFSSVAKFVLINDAPFLQQFFWENWTLKL